MVSTGQKQEYAGPNQEPILPNQSDYEKPEYPDDYPDNMKRLWSWYAYEVDVFKNLIQKEGTTDIGIELGILPAIPHR